MEAGVIPARARRREMQKNSFLSEAAFGEKPLGNREGERSASSRNTFRSKVSRIPRAPVGRKKNHIFSKKEKEK